MYQITVSDSEESDATSMDAPVGPEESDQLNENTIANDVEVTEGGWVCRVDRFEKLVDSAGRTHYYPRGEKADLSDASFKAGLPLGQPSPQPMNIFTVRERKLRKGKVRKGKVEGNKIHEEKVQKDKAQKEVQRSIIAYYYNTTKIRGGPVEPEAYIKIRSPLILKVLRENAKFNNEVRPHKPLWLPVLDYLRSKCANNSGSLW